jgi:hypothetical protein
MGWNKLKVSDLGKMNIGEHAVGLGTGGVGYLWGANRIAGEKGDEAKRNQSAQEQAAMQAAGQQGLGRAEQIFGQSLDQTGQDIQGLKTDLQNRVSQGGADPVSEAIRAQRGAAVANTNRAMAGRGAAGGVAAAAGLQTARSKDMDIAASLYNQQRASLQDYGGLLGTFASQAPALEMGYQNLALSGQQPNRSQGLLGGLLDNLGF